MESQIDKITAMIEADPKGFIAGMKAIQETANKATSDVSEKFNKMSDNAKIAGAVLTTYIVDKLVNFGEKAVKAFDDSEKAMALMTNALRATGGSVGFTSDQLVQLAMSLENVSTFGNTDILQGVTLSLLKFQKIQGEVFKRAQIDIVDYAAQTGESLSAASQQIGRALEDPTLALAVLRRAHISLSEQQKITIEHMNKIGDVAGAQAIILGALEGKFKGAAAAMKNTDAGRIASDMNKLNNALEDVGKILSKIILPVADAVGKLADGFRHLNEPTQKFIVISAVIVVAVISISTAIGFLSATLLPALTTGFWVLIDAAIDLGIALFEFVIPIGLVLAAIALLVVAGQSVYDNWSALKSLASGVWSWIAGMVQAAISKILGGFDSLPYVGEKFKKAAQQMKTDSDKNLGSVQKDLDDAKSKAVSLSDSWDHLKDNIAAAGAKIKKSISDTFGGGKPAGAGNPSPSGDGTPNAGVEWVNKVGEAYEKLPSLGEVVFGSMIQQATAFAQGMTQILLTGSGDWRQVLLNALQAMLNAIIQWAVTSLLATKAVAAGIEAVFSNPFLAIFAIGAIIAGVVALSSSLSKGPTPPKMAKGGLINKETTVTAGENGPEVILPVVRTSSGRMGVSTESTGSGGSMPGAGGGDVGVMHVQVNLDGMPIFKAIGKASKNGRLVIHPGSVRST